MALSQLDQNSANIHLYYQHFSWEGLMTPFCLHVYSQTVKQLTMSPRSMPCDFDHVLYASRWSVMQTQPFLEGGGGDNLDFFNMYFHFVIKYQSLLSICRLQLWCPSICKCFRRACVIYNLFYWTLQYINVRKIYQTFYYKIGLKTSWHK